MKIPSSRHRRMDRSDQSMTSMIDCVFLLLIFFVCASVGQLRESMLGTELPSGGVAANVAPPQDAPLDDVKVYLRREAGATTFEVNQRRHRDFAELEETLRGLAEIAPEIPVILDIDGSVPLGDVVATYDTCRSARFQSIHFATGPSPQAGK